MSTSMPPTPIAGIADLTQVTQATVALQQLPRRQFLRAASAAVAAATAALSVGPSLAWAAPGPAAPPALKFLNADEAAVMQRLLEVMLPTEGTPLLPLAQVPVLPTLDAALLATMAPHILAGLKGGIGYFNDGPQAMFGKRFVDLDDAQAIRFCDSWANAAEEPKRALSVGLKKLLALSYFANPPTWAPLGYPGPFTRRSGIPSLGNAPAPKA